MPEPKCLPSEQVKHKQSGVKLEQKGLEQNQRNHPHHHHGENSNSSLLGRHMLEEVEVAACWLGVVGGADSWAS